MLRKILETKKEEVARLKADRSIASFLSDIKTLPATLGFRHSLLSSSRSVSVIAEVKKASPSKGLIREPFNPLEIAQEYAHAQAEAISVLTDQQYFQGDLEYLRQIRESVAIPLLRKDFMIEEIQFAEARANGADCVLLIAAILDGQQLHHFSQVAIDLGMDVLVEVHDEEELDKVLTHTTPSLLGINNRDLRTFHTDLGTTSKLIARIPSDIPVVSESGISSAKDIAYLQENRARAVLVGEHFMRQQNVSQAVIDLVGERVNVVSGERS
jgi:indole-3-glycerol phosphate synthase